MLLGPTLMLMQMYSALALPRAICPRGAVLALINGLLCLAGEGGEGPKNCAGHFHHRTRLTGCALLSTPRHGIDPRAVTRFFVHDWQDKH
nr:hypothetical protein [Klebsiella pneumoniae]